MLVCYQQVLNISQHCYERCLQRGVTWELIQDTYQFGRMGAELQERGTYKYTKCYPVFDVFGNVLSEKTLVVITAWKPKENQNVVVTVFWK